MRLLRRDLAVRQGARLGGALLRDHRLALLRELGHLLVLTLHLAEGVLRREGGHPCLLLLHPRRLVVDPLLVGRGTQRVARRHGRLRLLLRLGLRALAFGRPATILPPGIFSSAVPFSCAFSLSATAAAPPAATEAAACAAASKPS